MYEIAVKSEDFKNTYVIQQELFADWMVSQKSFKELSTDFGLQLGKIKEKILEQGGSNEEKVLINTTNTNTSKD